MAKNNGPKFNLTCFYDPQKGTYRARLIASDDPNGEDYVSRHADLRDGHAQTDLFNWASEQLGWWVDNVCAPFLDGGGEAAEIVARARSEAGSQDG